MAIDVNIPSQVKSYANLAGFPATGSLKTIFIAEDTNKTYRWTGSAYVEISATAASTWGAITGTLSNQTDLQNALNAKQATLVSGTSIKTINSTSLLGSGDVAVQPTLVSATNIKTINGTTLLGSGDIAIASGITIGTTAITSGTVGRVLFEGTGNVVQESGNLFWDNTNGRLGLGTSTPATALSIYRSGSTNFFNFEPSATGTAPYMQAFFAGTLDTRIYFDNLYLKLRSGGTSTVYGLDCGNIAVNGNIVLSGGTEHKIQLAGSTNNYIQYTDLGATNIGVIGTADATSYIQVRTGNATNMSTGTLSTTFFNSGNVGIGALTTDAGFKLDVNGTARVTGNAIVGTSGIYCIGLIGSASSSKLQAYSNSGVSPIHSITFGYYTTTFDAQDITFNGPVNSKFFGQSTGNWIIGSTTSYASAQFGIDSTTKGFLPPRMTTTQKNAIATPATGLMVYDTTLNVITYYNGTTWI